MQEFDLGKKVFFLYPPHDFSKSIISKLFRDGFEIYKLNSTEYLLKLMLEYPDSILIVNTDYPYEDISFSDINDTIRNNEKYGSILLYTIFNESVSFGDNVKDYISLNRADEEVYQDMFRILTEAKAHGKRECVRFGNFYEYISTISFSVDDVDYSEGMHDISPKALSFSSENDLEHLVGKQFTNMKLKVGVYEITVHGKIESSRTIDGKKIYIAVFDLNDSEKDDVFNFIFTSLEMEMDRMIQKIG